MCKDGIAAGSIQKPWDECTSLGLRSFNLIWFPFKIWVGTSRAGYITRMVLCLSGSTKIKIDFEGVPKLRCSRFCINYAKHDTCDLSNMTLVTPKKVETLNSLNLPLLFTVYDWILLFYLFWGLLKGSPGGPVHPEITRNMLPGSTGMLWKSGAGRDMACCAEPSL